MRQRTAVIGSMGFFVVGLRFVAGVSPWLLTGWQFRDPRATAMFR